MGKEQFSFFIVLFGKHILEIQYNVPLDSTHVGRITTSFSVFENTWFIIFIKDWLRHNLVKIKVCMKYDVAISYNILEKNVFSTLNSLLMYDYYYSEVQN